jgi:hypothetical protein
MDVESNNKVLKYDFRVNDKEKYVAAIEFDNIIIRKNLLETIEYLKAMPAKNMALVELIPSSEISDKKKFPGGMIKIISDSIPVTKYLFDIDRYAQTPDKSDSRINAIQSKSIQLSLNKMTIGRKTTNDSILKSPVLKTNVKKPDYNLIEKEIQNASSKFYYPDLMQRMKTFDTTLTVEDYQYLYYGYVFDDTYNPYREFSEERRLIEKKLFKRNIKKITSKDCDTLIKLGTQSINEFPFDIRCLSFLSYLYELNRDKDMSNKMSSRCANLLDAIKSSGDGRTCETAYRVISISHEYILLNMFQARTISRQLSVMDCDYYELDNTSLNYIDMDSIYFWVLKKRRFK